MKAKDEFQTDHKRQAWQHGYDMVLEHRGPKDPVHQALDEACPGTSRVAIHPLSMELLADELGLGEPDFEKDATPCQAALPAGFLSALLNGAAGDDR